MDHVRSVTEPGRLKLRSRSGCMSCRLRKRKCDEERPICKHCKRLGYECQWLSDAGSQESQQMILARQSRQRRRLPLDVAPELGAAGQLTFIPHCRIAGLDDVRISFMLDTMFKGANTAIQTGIAGNALTVHTELQFASEEESLTYKCLNSMAMIHWGVVKNDRTVLNMGYSLRGRNLASIRAAITRTLTATSGDLVAAVALMRLADTLMPNARSQWMIHAEALTHLFRAIGPEAFSTSRMRRLVENNRWVMIMASSMTRKRTLLDTAAWKTVPWRGAYKDLLQTLLDIYARLPTLHAVFDESTSPASNENEIREGLALFRAELENVLAQMQRWRTSVDEIIKDSIKKWDPVDTSVMALPNGRPAVAFERLYHAYAIVLFNMIIIVLSKYILKTLPSNPAPPGKSGEAEERRDTLLQAFVLPVDKPLQRAADAADEIAQILPWAIKDSNKGGGALYMAAPAVVCQQFWGHFDADKALWFGSALRQVGGVWDSLLILNPTRANEMIQVLM